jgi:hypothetical protein
MRIKSSIEDTLKMTTRRGDDDGFHVLGSWSQANSVLAQAAPLGVWETVSRAGRFYRYLHTYAKGIFVRAMRSIAPSEFTIKLKLISRAT